MSIFSEYHSLLFLLYSTFPKGSLHLLLKLPLKHLHSRNIITGLIIFNFVFQTSVIYYYTRLQLIEIHCISQYIDLIDSYE